MIMAESTGSTQVEQLHKLLVLAESNMVSTKRKRRADKKSIEWRTVEKNSQGFYEARENLVNAVFEEMSADDTRCVRNALVATGVSHIPVESVRFYYDMQPLSLAATNHWWLHVFYGGKGRPMGHDHGHIIVKVNTEGEVVSIKLHRRPGSSAAHHNSKLQ
jgi:hypothetical protein